MLGLGQYLYRCDCMSLCRACERLQMPCRVRHIKLNHDEGAITYNDCLHGLAQAGKAVSASGLAHTKCENSGNDI